MQKLFLSTLLQLQLQKKFAFNKASYDSVSQPTGSDICLNLFGYLTGSNAVC